MNIKQLEVFVAIVETGSFSRGAERACLTQSTASQHIAALESACGLRLLDRTGRGAMPTEAGKALMVHARGVLAALQETEQAMRRFSRAEDVVLKMAASTIPGTYLVPAAVALLGRELSSVHVTVAIGDSSAVMEQIASGSVEVGVLGNPVSDNRLDSEPIGHDRIVLVAAAGCPHEEITVDDLAGVPLVQRETGSGTGRIVAEALRRAGFDPATIQASVVMGSSEAVKQAILAGCGAAFLSEAAVRDEVASGILQKVAVRGVSIERTFTLSWRRGRALSPAAQSFCRLLRQVAGGGS